MGVDSFRDIENKLQKADVQFVDNTELCSSLYNSRPWFLQQITGAGNNDNAMSHFPTSSPLPVQKYKASKV